MPSKLEQMQLQFRQRLKEERMIKIHTDNQQKALSKVQKYDAVHTSTVQTTVTVPKPPQPAIVPPQPHHSPIKKGSPGVDRSRPLPPIYKEQRNSSSNRSSPTENGSKIAMTTNSRSRSVDLEQKNASSRPLQNGVIKMQPRNGLSKPISFDPNPVCQPETSPPRNGISKPANFEPKLEYQPETSPPRNGISKPTYSEPKPEYQPETSPPRNGISKPANFEPKSEYQPETSPPRNGISKTLYSEPKISCQPETTPEKKLDQEVKSRLKQAELQRLKANTKVREESSSRNGLTGAISKSSTEPRRTTRPSNPVAAAPSRARPRAQPAASTTMRKPAVPPAKPTSRAAATTNASKDSGPPRKPPGPGQEQCTVCGRNFNQDRIEKHRSICKKVATKKVKVFDATKMRVKGTEAEQFVKKGLPKSNPKPSKKCDWRKKHNEFIETIRQAKMVQQHLAKGGKVSDLPPPPPSDTSDYVPCPHCGRKFNEAVAERHIPKCQNISCNKKKPVPTRRR